MSLGDFLKRELAARNWSGRDLSARTYEVAEQFKQQYPDRYSRLSGIEPSTVSDIFRNVRDMQMSTLFAVALALETREDSAGSWFARLISEMGYPIADAAPGTFMSEIGVDLSRELARLTSDQQTTLTAFLRQLHEQ